MVLAELYTAQQILQREWDAIMRIINHGSTDVGSSFIHLPHIW